MTSIESVAQAFCSGHYDDKLPDQVWPLAFAYIIDNLSKLPLHRERVQMLWIVNGGHLRGKTRDDELIKQVLGLVLPGYSGEGLILYRGECRFLYESGRLGFCWTPRKDVAEMFARGLNAIESGGVLLRAYAPTEAIFSAPNAHSAKQMQELEFTCNPMLLEGIEVIENYHKLP